MQTQGVDWRSGQDGCRGGEDHPERLSPDAFNPCTGGYYALNAPGRDSLYSSGWDVLADGQPVDVGFDKHLRINKQKTFAKGRARINGIEAFWSFTKRRLAKFNGGKVNFGLHLKEGEWRYSKSASFLAKNLLTLIKNPVEVLV